MSEQTSPVKPGPRPRQPSGGWPYSRVLAALVLVPAVPMLLLSVGTLLLFYLAPVRFGTLLARLPGESFIRTALVFAPATLFAIVVLAVLYAVEKPAGEQVERAAPAPADARAAAQAGRWAWRMALGIAVPLWLFSLGLWSLSFISPGRFDRLLAPLPGDSYLRPFVPYAPWVLFVLVLAAGVLAFTRNGAAQGQPGRDAGRLLRPTIGVVLTAALPVLLGSLAALAVYWLRPETFARVIERIPFDTLVRAALVFVPPTSFVVVVLASLYLLATRRPGPQAVEQAHPPASSALRSNVALLVLIAGLGLSAALGLGLAGSMLYLILR